MERWPFIRWGIAASVLAHIVAAALIFLSTDVRRFEAPAPEAVAVDIVESDEPEKPLQPAPSPSPSPDLALPKPDTSSTSPTAAPAPAPAPASAPTPQPTPTREAKAQPPSQPQAQPQPPPETQQTPTPAPTPAPSSAPSYVPQPDLTVKYGVMLGLPPPLPPLPASGNDADESKDAGPSASTNLAANLTGPFRQHLRSCSKLPASVSRSDNIMVKLRVVMTPDGRLAADPVLLAGTASVKALEMKQSAVRALAACQPYAMLPPDRYREWKVLELSFTPQDFVD
ncbi:hypothetical protein ACQR1W_29185 [Bradyrhizobium sp. HKCCYLS1011]|uniref:hypothetical protein n=1 Tax=Bradyrhizobium sp. HKCCYLS1011 TaxID=3420733 RepID=UPI003EBA2C5C